MGLPRNSSTGASFYRNVSSEKESNCTFNWSPWPTFWLSAPILSSPPHTVSPSTSPASFSLPPAWSLNTYTLGQKLKTFITTKIGPLVTKHKVKMAGCWPKSRQIEMQNKRKEQEFIILPRELYAWDQSRRYWMERNPTSSTRNYKGSPIQKIFTIVFAVNVRNEEKQLHLSQWWLGHFLSWETCFDQHKYVIACTLLACTVLVFESNLSLWWLTVEKYYLYQLNSLWGFLVLGNPLLVHFCIATVV